MGSQGTLQVLQDDVCVCARARAWHKPRAPLVPELWEQNSQSQQARQLRLGSGEPEAKISKGAGSECCGRGFNSYIPAIYNPVKPWKRGTVYPLSTFLLTFLVWQERPGSSLTSQPHYDPRTFLKLFASSTLLLSFNISSA